ncbi:hypothetical protein [Streptomyces sp. NPDC057557]|uniref:hypothetical protein n=1 Tax=Streptomyces sp. NPDC057557 TaxID=3346167 RepID=UPI0036BA0DC4
MPLSTAVVGQPDRRRPLLSGVRDDLDQLPRRGVVEREMTVRTVAEHNGDEPWLVPVPDTWARAAKITIPVQAAEGGIDSGEQIGQGHRTD